MKARQKDALSGSQSANEAGSSAIRLDKWLWQARFLKSRSLAKDLVESRKVRINGDIIAKASKTVSIGDVLTFPFCGGIMICKVADIGSRRGPASEAQTLYNTIEDPRDALKEDTNSPTMLAKRSPSRERGTGRPTKKDRRSLDKWQQEQDF